MNCLICNYILEEYTHYKTYTTNKWWCWHLINKKGYGVGYANKDGGYTYITAIYSNTINTIDLKGFHLLDEERIEKLLLLR